MSTTEIEKRLTAIESQLARLKEGRAPVAKSHPIHALEHIHGTFEKDEAFTEAMRLGRQWHAGKPPQARKAKPKRS